MQIKSFLKEIERFKFLIHFTIFTLGILWCVAPCCYAFNSDKVLA